MKKTHVILIRIKRIFNLNCQNISMKHLNAPKYTLILTTIIYSVFIILQLKIYNYDITRFIFAGERYVDSRLVTQKIFISQGDGYDGQFYYRLAIDPFTKKVIDYGITFDSPMLRQQRILYPLLTRLFTFGSPTLIPFMLVFLNYIVLGLLGWMGGIYVKKLDLHALYGTIFPLFVGFIITLTRNLTEIVEITLIMSFFLLLRQKKHLLSTIFLSLAVLTKETALIVPLAAFFTFLINIKGRKNVFKWYLFTVPVSVYIVYHAYLYYTWNGLFAIDDIKGHIGYPLIGFLRFFHRVSPLNTEYDLHYFLEIISILIFTVIVGLCLSKSKVCIIEKVSWILYLILDFSLTACVWVEDNAFFRALSELYLIGFMILLNHDTKLKKLIIISGIIFWFLVTSRYFWISFKYL
jgi:hypothetical protein